MIFIIKVTTNKEERAEGFMKDSHNVDAAEFEFKQRVQEAKKRGEDLTQEGVKDYGRRHGWNTGIDEKIMDSVLKKEGISSNPEHYKRKLDKRNRHQNLVNQISNQMITEGQKERQQIIQKMGKKKYF